VTIALSVLASRQDLLRYLLPSLLRWSGTFSGLGALSLQQGFAQLAGSASPFSIRSFSSCWAHELHCNHPQSLAFKACSCTLYPFPPMVLRIEPRASRMLGKCSDPDPHPISKSFLHCLASIRLPLPSDSKPAFPYYLYNE
jgi:hypothetical protein